MAVRWLLFLNYCENCYSKHGCAWIHLLQSYALSTGSIFVSCPEEKMQFSKRRQHYPGYSNESYITVKIPVFYVRLHPNPLYVWSNLVIVTAHEISASATAFFFVEIKVQRGKELSIFNTWKSRTKATVEAMYYSKPLPSELYCWTVDQWSHR